MLGMSQVYNFALPCAYLLNLVVSGLNDNSPPKNVLHVRKLLASMCCQTCISLVSLCPSRLDVTFFQGPWLRLCLMSATFHRFCPCSVARRKSSRAVDPILRQPLPIPGSSQQLWRGLSKPLGPRQKVLTKPKRSARWSRLQYPSHMNQLQHLFNNCALYQACYLLSAASDIVLF